MALPAVEDLVLRAPAAAGSNSGGKSADAGFNSGGKSVAGAAPSAGAAAAGAVALPDLVALVLFEPFPSGSVAPDIGLL